MKFITLLLATALPTCVAVAMSSAEQPTAKDIRISAAIQNRILREAKISGARGIVNVKTYFEAYGCVLNPA
jgi:hypothetical protein